MPKIHLVRSIHINAPVEEVFKKLNDFHQWQPWSPWLIMDPDATVDVQPDGKYYSWEGARVGKGNMTVTDEQLNQSVDYDLVFLAPWKSKAKVVFNTKASDNGTEVSWSMDSRLPFFLFWMKKSMTGFIAMDYDRGLNMLKDYVEDGKVHSKLHFKGVRDFNGYSYAGITRTCEMADLGTSMVKDLDRLHQYFLDKQDLVADPPFTIYHKWDIARGQVKYTSAVPVLDPPNNLPDPLQIGSIPVGKVYTLEHVGPYRHLGNAWTTMHSMMRQKEFKAVKGVHPFESYLSNPQEVAENDLITQINFMVK